MARLNRLRAHLSRFIEALTCSIISTVTAVFITISTTVCEVSERVAMLMFFILDWIHRIAPAFRASLRRIAVYVRGFRELCRRLFLLVRECIASSDVTDRVLLVLITIMSGVVINSTVVPVLFQTLQLVYSIFAFIVLDPMFLTIKGILCVFYSLLQIVVALLKAVGSFVAFIANSAVVKFVWSTTWSITAKIVHNVVFVLLPFMARASYNLLRVKWVGSLILILCGMQVIVKFHTILYGNFFSETDDKQYAITLSSSAADQDRNNSQEEATSESSTSRRSKYDNSQTTATNNDSSLLLSGSGKDSEDGVRAPEDVNEGHIRQDTLEKPICSDFLRGKCKKGSTCRKHHCPLPFHWLYFGGGNWRSFTEEDNEKIEKVYCDEKLDECTVADVNISFERFEQNGFRRLSTTSYVTDLDNTMSTQWTWYWKDEYEIWRKYDQDQGGGDLQQSFEVAFLNGNNGFRFRIAGQNYNMTFFPTSKMSQINERYNTTRKVRRRPAKFVSRDDIQKLRSRERAVLSSVFTFVGPTTRSHNLMTTAQNKKVSVKPKSSDLPAHWSPMPSKTQYKRVPLASFCPEFKEVEKLFRKSIKRKVKITSVERVQNPFMWEKYQRKKENMLASRKSSVNEKQLFHGTNPDIVEAICKQNFDWRLHGKNATVYGEGSYFAVNSSYSDAYAKADISSSKFMFVARVLVGSYAVGNSSYRRPPQKDPSNPASDLYDSCVDNICSPTIFVVFDTDQCYPEYIIEYAITQL